MREHWPAFRERAEEHGGMPAFVVRDFEEYVRCGLPEHGLCHLAMAIPVITMAIPVITMARST
ncbi:MAG: hypothetical protein M3Y87_07035 [Myxococcota bacterium]|nr:hypothetical protein [Myxococcota bacterium]